MSVHDGGTYDNEGLGGRPEGRPIDDPAVGDGAGFEVGHPGRGLRDLAYDPTLAMKGEGWGAIGGDFGVGKSLGVDGLREGLDPTEKEGR